MADPFGAKTPFQVGGRSYMGVRLAALEGALPGVSIQKLPYAIRVLLESVVRNCDDFVYTKAHIEALARYDAKNVGEQEVPFMPGRVVLQDFTGVPAVVDLAALRQAMARMGGDVTKVNPLIRASLVVDHSIEVMAYGSPSAMKENTDIEFQRNLERYRFLKWGQQAFRNFTVVPPATGIVHQVNLEYLADGVLQQQDGEATVVYPDSLVGTDSHTTMINGLGIVGWGVGGIEAEACMLGQPIYLLIPEVVGFELTGKLAEGVTATDLVLTVTQMLRKHGVVGRFVEFYGSGLDHLSLADRATIANMAPEYGATIGFFPVDDRTIAYLRQSGRSEELCQLVEAYHKHAGLWRDGSADIVYSSTLKLDLGTVVPSLAGPKRPQDRVPLDQMQRSFLSTRLELGHTEPRHVPVQYKGHSIDLHDGAVTIAAITSCTNTSNPAVMVAAGLVARKARARGLTARPWVKTSLAPGSRVVTDYLDKAGLTDDLNAIGFYTVGYGCTTCIATGTPVLLANGTARRIEQMPSAGAQLFSPTQSGQLGIATQTDWIEQGVRDCVTLTLQDGRELVCTPDHEILCEDGRWVRADRLVPHHDRVVVGLEAPLDEPGDDEAGYSLCAGDLKFTLDTAQERLRTLAFARLLGHLLGDGSISTLGQGRICVGQAVDREVVLQDIELITGKRPAAKRYDERKWAIVLPKELTDAISALPGVRVGRRIHQAPTLPSFLLDDRCPTAVVREFLAGAFGADGHAPTLHRYGAKEESASFEPPAYSQSAKPEHVGQLKELMQQILSLLGRCGVKTEGAKVYEYPVRRSASSYPHAQDGAPRTEVRLELPCGLSFVERVGFRYCVDKALRASAAAMYWRLIEKIHQQRLWMSARLQALHRQRPELSFAQARELAAAELERREPIVSPHYSLLAECDRFSRLPKPGDRKFRPLHRESCSFPSPSELLKELGARGWFSSLSRGEAAYAKHYCVEKDALALPTFSLKVIDRRDAGKRAVFDLSVDGPHSFIAGTVGVHNCIGNAGPLPDPIREGIEQGDLVVASVLSGNRNFEGRVSPHTRVNYLASPPLVVAYALAGTVDIDLTTAPLGEDSAGKPVFLKDIWPTNEEIEQTIASSMTREQYVARYANVYEGPPEWKQMPAPTGELYAWEESSTYIQEPPFFMDMKPQADPIAPILGARVLAKLGDSVTTDHISPAGTIAKGSPAEEYLLAHGVQRKDFNSYGSRRGNDQVMTRGTFANIRIKNAMVPGGKEGGLTTYLGPAETPPGPYPWLRYTSTKDPQPGEVVSIYDASVKYQKHRIPLVVLAGKDYGMGSSRDWAAKGTYLLGIRAVIAQSYERIHRSNLVGMGVLPLEFKPGESADSLGLTGEEILDIAVDDNVQPMQDITVKATKPDGTHRTFQVKCRIDTPVEVVYYRNGGILHTVLRRLAQ